MVVDLVVGSVCSRMIGLWFLGRNSKICLVIVDLRIWNASTRSMHQQSRRLSVRHHSAVVHLQRKSVIGRTRKKADILEFVVMSGSLNLWKELADWVHFAPSDFAVPFFLSAAHAGELPVDSFVSGMRSLVDAPPEDLATTKFHDLAKNHPQVYQAF